MFTAVPRTPPPAETPANLKTGLASAILNSSLLGQLFGTPRPPSSEQGVSDPDTSLYDYDQLGEPGYSSVDFYHSTPGPSDPQRDKLDTPPQSHNVTVDIAPPIYSQPVKKGKRKTMSISDSELTDVSSDLGQQSPEVSPRREFPEAVPAKDSLKPTESPIPQFRSSPRLNALQDEHKRLLEQQGELERQLQLQQQQYNNSIKKMEQQLQQLQHQKRNKAAAEEEVGLLKQQKGEAEKKLQQQENLISNLKSRVNNLEQGNKELDEMNQQLHNTLDVLRHKMEDMNRAGENGRLRRQIDDLREDIESLQETVHRLNVELSRYQAAYRPPQLEKQGQDISGLPTKGPIPAWLINKKYLSPLFLAYDDKIKEKDDIIDSFEEDLAHFRDQIEEILKENERLHLRLEQTDATDVISATEWQQLQEQAKLVLEENQLLMEQLDLQQSKAQDMHKAHVTEVSRLTQQLVQAEAEKSELENSVMEQRHKYSQMKHEHDSLLIEAQEKLPIHEHKSAINELRRSLDENKQHYLDEMQELKSKLQSVQSEKKNLAVKAKDLIEEKEQLKADVRNVQRQLKKSEQQLAKMRAAVRATTDQEMTITELFNDFRRHVDMTVYERDSLAKQAEDYEVKANEIMEQVVAEKVNRGRIEERLQMYKSRAADKITIAVNRLKEQEASFENERAEFRREIRHLQLIVKEKDDVISSLNGDKKRVEEDLETMWQAATRDNMRMKESLRKSYHKSGHEDRYHSDHRELLLLSSDSER
ncbi:centrosomal protein of 89 kDa isoform X2 [Lingula anatina]|nr:centrosomal protein of 89 kDa isoform X2 [Lingula anatina]|eukprot:XP_013408731.1 centrosomal protein of 89 kDa isoform X2 [Lingula anatina]